VAALEQTIGRPAQSAHGPVLAREQEAHTLLADDRFIEAWDRLHAECPWASVFLGSRFARTWFAVYGARYSPLLLHARSSDGLLSGLFVGAVARDGAGNAGEVIPVGAHHAEYQSWLARPDDAGRFIAAALDTLARFGARRLRFLFLAPGTPLDWLPNAEARGARWRAVVRWHTRGLMNLGKDSSVHESLRKSHTRNRLSRMKAALGEVAIRRLTSEAELRAHIDDIATYLDVRKGGIFGTLPFADDNDKKRLYLSLMQTPALLHATVLSAGATVVAAHLGFREKDMISLGVMSYAPQYSQYSPGNLLLLMLGRLLGEEGYEVFDLTPGGEYKGRFATHHDDVAALEVFFRRRDYLLYRARRSLLSVLRRTIGADRLARGARLLQTRNIIMIARQGRIAARSATALKLAARWINSTREFEFFCLPLPEAGFPEEESRICINEVSHLLLYRPAPDAADSLGEFLASALERFNRGQVLFTAVERGVLVHCAWLIPATTKVGSDYGHEIRLNRECAVLHNDYTLPEARGRGYQQESIRARVRYARERLGKEIALAGIRAENGQSRHNYEKCNFRKCGSAWHSVRLGRIRLWPQELTLPDQAKPSSASVRGTRADKSGR